jgi:molybdopterin/thiamine biosynthesis adenylyltransferase|tara:strand:- start:872 stop:1735 length:864 start_codon:yes stop_codon:yes gene_type:complete
LAETFDYQTAFSRNLGWVTEAEQHLLSARRIAIAGLGGVGGSHLLSLARLGIGSFHVADMDIFELANFNRQVGATIPNLGRPKVEVLTEMATAINPELDIKTFPEGVALNNLDQFLAGVDLYVDGLDFFALDIRQAVFAACADKGIPAITAAPLGMGVALLCFMPGKMTFEQYFRMKGLSENEQLLHFLLGLSPAMLQSAYLVDDSRVDLAAHKGPSTNMACELCAGVAATHALKVLLNRGKILAAPYGLHFDAYRNSLKTTWRPWGNTNPIQKLGLFIARKRLGIR